MHDQISSSSLNLSVVIFHFAFHSRHVVLGEHTIQPYKGYPDNITTKTDNGAEMPQVVEIEDIAIHEDYKAGKWKRTREENDIALIRLKTPATLTIVRHLIFEGQNRKTVLIMMIHGNDLYTQYKFEQ